MIHYLRYIALLCALLLFCSGVAAAAPRKAPSPHPAATVTKAPPTASPAHVQEIKYWSNPDYTRIAIALDRDTTWKSNELDKGSAGKPGRIFIDIQNARLGPAVKDIPIGDGLLKKVRVAQFKPGVVRIVLDTDNFKDYKIFPLSDPARLIIDVRGERREEIHRLEATLSSQVQEAAVPAPAAPAKAEQPVPPPPLPAAEKPAKGRKTPPVSKIRRIVVDPGHGGHDPGAVGPTGLQEKEVVLSIGLKLRELLKEELGLDVVMTRSTDVFIPLEERTAIANKVGADLFVSIHANAAPNRSAAGIETYYLNLAKTEKVAQLAAKENGTTLEKVSVLQAILFDLMANYKLNDSAHLAEEIQRALYKATKSRYPETKNLGVKQGPFYVLVGATMPSILTEVAFISNSVEEAHLRNPAYLHLAAEGIMEGVRSYIASLK
ncbi:N-acetylmuramoyl-L-alanine amidase [Trichlorobacter ammonificans]|uniref:N-acetylmuramoyl-L-alanine amidase n=1 Tax=Trichlorobacter ammonificans TaxID=2916410 RepID=A0ABN8HF09_9BACT|nr:N-acetylmuramoyl-L-alanine amidase [Trichlorobacter ammonificans]CAH2031449.1 N-acetylmuramoyl-L-alanine amidase [Trichlorobacter ammonificans]